MNKRIFNFNSGSNSLIASMRFPIKYSLYIDIIVYEIIMYSNYLILLHQEGFAFAHCTTCKAPYHLRVHVLADRKWRTLKFRFFVTRDILFIFIAVQLVGPFFPLYSFILLSFLHFTSIISLHILCVR